MMNLTEPLLLAFSLSLDCFAISISQGLRADKTNRGLLILAVLFGLFQAGMFVFGYLTGNWLLSFFSQFARFGSALLLALIGLKMLKEANNDEQEEVAVTNVRDYLFLSVATSVDAFAAGVSFISLQASFLLTCTLVGLISFLLAIIGGFSGNRIGEAFGKKAEIFGGLILILLAIKVVLV